MHRIDTPTAQKDKFGAGKNGFTRGNPQTGTPATDLDDDYFDMLQEELAGVVEASGVNLEKSKHNQLLTALKALLLSRAHPFADIKADGAAAIAEALSNLGLSNAMHVGDFGLGVKNETKPGGMAALGVTQFDYFNPADNIGPLPGSWCGGLSYAMGDDIGFQLAGSGQLQPYENPRLFLRSKFADKTFTQWGEIYHTLNKPTASDLGLTLGTAASRDVGTGTSQIPDMSSFTS
ncbi:integrase, partial [Citrobacter freundii]|uniref:integrase n=2 Tax=Citrobacter freundii TaxID=546 RepID=UPI001D02F276